MTKTIELTKDKIALVDDEDYEVLARHKWYACKDGHTFYAKRAIRDVDGKRRWVRMHRVIMGALPGEKIDHADGNGLDNRQEYWRCTHQENERNQRKQANRSSQFKGVVWNKRDKKWQAQINVDGKHRHLGYFAVEEDAARAYDAAAIRLFGEFARPNYRHDDSKELAHGSLCKGGERC